MNNKVNYTAIGFSVLIAFSFILLFIYWLVKPTVDDKTSKYLIYFDESVLGLNVDAPVKYKGISVGRVTRLKINPDNSEQIEVLITILKNTPIKVDTEAKLTAQGITGLSYINLNMGKHNSKQLVKQDGKKYPVIKAVPSFFKEIEGSLGDVSSGLTDTLSKTQELLNDTNQEQIALLLLRSASFMDKLEKVLDTKNQKELTKIIQHTSNILEKVDLLFDEKMISQMKASVKNIETVTTNVDKMIPNIDGFIYASKEWEENINSSFASIMDSYVGIKSSMDEIKRAVASGEFNVKDITSDLVPTMNNTLLDMQDLMIRFSETLEQYDRSPSDILFKKEETNKGPGEK